MKPTAPTLTFLRFLLLSLLAGGASAEEAPAGQDAPPGDRKALFQSTHWRAPADFSPDLGTLASPVNDASGTPAFLRLSAPRGGRLRMVLEEPAGYKIKKILLCSDQNRPLPGVKVRLVKDGAFGPAVELPFRHMSGVAPGCAVYAPAQGQDDWGQPGEALDGRIYTKLEILLPPSKTLAAIEAVGVRLQAAAPAYPALKPQESRPQPACLAFDRGGDGRCLQPPLPAAAKEDVANVYFSQYTADAGRAVYSGKAAGNGKDTP